jgi:hypothetical protein
MEGDAVGEQLLQENILVREKQRKGTRSTYDLILEDEVLFALEWLRDFDELGSKGITFDLAKTKRKFAGVYMTNSTTRREKCSSGQNINPAFSSLVSRHQSETSIACSF